jgi:hypothetical protein
MAWAYFQNQAAFDLYHNAVCADQAIPKAGYTTHETVLAILNTWTDAYVAPIQVKSTGNVTTWAAHIPDSHLVTYASKLGLTTSDSAVTFNVGANGLPDGTVTIQGQGTFTLQPNTLNYRKVKPPTWTDPKTGITYNTTTGLPV